MPILRLVSARPVESGQWGEGKTVIRSGFFMGLELHQPHGGAGSEKLPVRVEQAIASSEEIVVSHLLDPAVGNDVRALRAVLKVSRPSWVPTVSTTHSR